MSSLLVKWTAHMRGPMLKYLRKLGGQPGEPSVHFDLLSSGSLVAPSGSLVVPKWPLVVP